MSGELPRPRKGWEMDANCRQGMTEMTDDHPPEGSHQVCVNCPAIRDCALKALADPSPAGIWAGRQMTGRHTDESIRELREIAGVKAGGKLPIAGHARTRERREDLAKRAHKFQTIRQAAEHYDVCKATVTKDCRMLGIRVGSVKIDGLPSVGRKKTCKKGHADWKVRENGTRQCLECNRIRTRARQNARAA